MEFSATPLGALAAIISGIGAARDYARQQAAEQERQRMEQELMRMRQEQAALERQQIEHQMAAEPLQVLFDLAKQSGLGLTAPGLNAAAASLDTASLPESLRSIATLFKPTTQTSLVPPSPATPPSWTEIIRNQRFPAQTTVTTPPVLQFGDTANTLRNQQTAHNAEFSRAMTQMAKLDSKGQQTYLEQLGATGSYTPSELATLAAIPPKRTITKEDVWRAHQVEGRPGAMAMAEASGDPALIELAKASPERSIALIQQDYRQKRDEAMQRWREYTYALDRNDRERARQLGFKYRQAYIAAMAAIAGVTPEWLAAMPDYEILPTPPSEEFLNSMGSQPKPQPQVEVAEKGGVAPLIPGGTIQTYVVPHTNAPQANVDFSRMWGNVAARQARMKSTQEAAQNVNLQRAQTDLEAERIRLQKLREGKKPPPLREAVALTPREIQDSAPWGFTSEMLRDEANTVRKIMADPRYHIPVKKKGGSVEYAVGPYGGYVPNNLGKAAAICANIRHAGGTPARAIRILVQKLGHDYPKTRAEFGLGGRASKLPPEGEEEVKKVAREHPKWTRDQIGAFLMNTHPTWAREEVFNVLESIGR